MIGIVELLVVFVVLLLVLALPIGGLLLFVLARGRRSDGGGASAGMVACPVCGGRVAREDAFCRHCGQGLAFRGGEA